MEVTLSKRRYDENTGKVEKAVDDSAFNAAALSALSIPANLAGSAIGAVDAVGNKLQGKAYNPYGYNKMLSNLSADTRQYVGENIAEATEGMNFLGQNVPAFLYQTAMSMGDSAGAAILGGGIGSALLGSSAALQQAKELKEAGATEGQVIAGGLAAGAFETLFEKYSLDSLLKNKGVDSVGRWAVESLKQAGVEGSEEIFTETANLITDTLLRGQNSDALKRYHEYLERGFSEMEAGLKVVGEDLSQIALSGIGGALSGGIMGGTVSAASGIQNKQTGKDLKAKGLTADVLETASMSTEGMESYKLQNKLAKKGITEENIKDARLGNLYNTMNGEVFQNAVSQVSNDKLQITAHRLAEMGYKGSDIMELSKAALTEETARSNAQKQLIERSGLPLDSVNALRTSKELNEGYKPSKNTLKARDQVYRLGKINEGEVISDKAAKVRAEEIRQERPNLSQNEALMEAYAEGMDDAKRETFFSNSEGIKDVDAYVASFNLVYEYGRDGFGADTALNNRGVLSPSQTAAVYKAGIMNKVAERQKNVDAITAKYASDNHITAGTFDDSIIDYNNKGKGVNWSSLNTTQRGAVALAKTLSKATGINITLTESKVGENGKYEGAAGSYNPDTNTIELDINSGLINISDSKDMMVGAMVSTLSHETTHWMKDKAPQLYQQLTDIVMDTLSAAPGYTAGGKLSRENIIHREMDRIERAHQDIRVTEEYAVDELVARACEDMLSNSKTAQEYLEQLPEAERKSLYEKIKDAIDKLKQWIKDLLGQYSSKSTEAQILREYKEKLDILQDTWDKAFKAAVTANQALQRESAGKEFIEKSVVQYADKIDAKINLDATVEQTKELVAVHNLTEDKLEKTFKLDGFPMPSIAITKAALGHSDFGDISFVFGKDTIDPAQKKNKVYAADAWTPTFPKIEYEPDVKRIWEIKEQLEPLIEKIPERMVNSARAFVSALEYNLDNYGGYEGVVDRALNEEVMKQVYLAMKDHVVEDIVIEKRIEMDEMDIEISKNILEVLGDDIVEISKKAGKEIYANYGYQIESAMKKAYMSFGINEEGAENVIANMTKLGIVKQLREARDYKLSGGITIKRDIDFEAIRKEINFRIDRQGFEKWVRQTFAGIVKNEGFWNGKDFYTPNGNRRSFKETHLPISADNIVKAMLAQNDDVRNVDGFNGVKSIRAVAVEEFKNLKTIRQAKEKLKNIDSVEYETMNEELSERLYRVIDDIIEVSDKAGSGNHYVDSDRVGFAILDACTNPTVENIKNILAGYGWKCSESQAKEIKNIIDTVINMPVNMFEAKPQRVVGFDEIRYAIVPDDISEKGRALIEGKNIPIREYETGNEESRLEVLNSLKDIQFSDRINSDEESGFSVKEQLLKASNTLNMMQPISQISESRTFGKKQDAKEWALEEFTKYDFKVNRSGFGEIILDKKRISKGMSYLSTLEEIYAFMTVPDVLKNGIEIARHPVHKGRNYSTVTFAAPVIINGQRGNVAVVVRQEGYNYYKVHRLIMPDGKQFVLNKQKDTVETAGGVENNSGLSPTNNVFKDIIPNSAENTTKSYQDRFTDDFYELFAEGNTMEKESEVLGEDLVRLADVVKMTGKKAYTDKLTAKVARFIRTEYNSNYDQSTLAGEISKIYDYIANEENLQWNNVMNVCYELAGKVLGEQKGKSSQDYAKMILRDIKGTKISLNSKQAEAAKSAYGSDYRYQLAGRIKFDPNGISLSRQWEQWSEQYPDIFDASVAVEDQITALVDLYSDLQDVSERVQIINDSNAKRQVALEIYNKFWTLQTESMQVKYETDIKKLKAEHREAMRTLKIENAYAERWFDAQAKAKYGEMVKEIRARKDAEIQDIKTRSKARMDNYKDRVTKKALVDGITKKAKSMNKRLKENSKNAPIPEVMKPAVTKLLAALDFSSRQLLGMYNTPYAYTPTKTDISLSDAFAEVREMALNIQKVGATEDSVENLYVFFPDAFVAKIEKMVKEANTIMRKVGDNHYILNEMSVEQLESLNEVIDVIRKTCADINEMHSTRNKEKVNAIAQDSMVHMHDLGERNTLFEGAKKFLGWSNTLPINAFRRFGPGGVVIFEAFQDAWDKYAFMVKDIIERTKKLYEPKDVRAWSKEVLEFQVIDKVTLKYRTVRMPVTHAMSLYCLSKREQARKHILGGGIRVEDFTEKGKKVSQTEAFTLGEAELNAICSKLTQKQKEVADALQAFMNTECAAWGNETSMQLYGIRSFMEKNYFPITSDKNGLNTDGIREDSNSIYKLLNMSFTKPLNLEANNTIIVRNIFDVFAEHSSDMAKYHCFGPAVLDAFRWFNYKEDVLSENKDATQKKNMSVKEAMERAYGKAAQEYVLKFLKDINGSDAKLGDADALMKKSISKFKRASVGANVRVGLLQPMSYLRAAAVINPKYLAAGMIKKPAIKEAKEHSGIALWKSLGFYDVNISRGLKSMIKHDETWADKLTDKSMILAEKMDSLTWGVLWNACKAEVEDKHRDFVKGSEAYYHAVSDRFREVVYKTQVVDSTMTRTQMMREKGVVAQMTTAFMSESMVSYNMVMDVFYEWTEASRLSGSYTKTLGKYGRKFTRAVGVYAVTAFATALEGGLPDAARDEDDEKEFLEKYWENVKSNFLSDLFLPSKLPIVKDIVSIFQGYNPSRMDEQGYQTAYYAYKQWDKVLDGKGNPYKAVQQTLQAVSQLTGVPVSNLTREIVTLWNNTIGLAYPSLKIKIK